MVVVNYESSSPSQFARYLLIKQVRWHEYFRSYSMLLFTFVTNQLRDTFKVVFNHGRDLQCILIVYWREEENVRSNTTSTRLQASVCTVHYAEM